MAVNSVSQADQSYLFPVQAEGYSAFLNAYHRATGRTLDSDVENELKAAFKNDNILTRDEFEKIFDVDITKAAWKAFIAGFDRDGGIAPGNEAKLYEKLQKAFEKFSLISSVTGQSFRYFCSCRTIFTLDSGVDLEAMNAVIDDPEKLQRFIDAHSNLLKQKLSALIQHYQGRPGLECNYRLDDDPDNSKMKKMLLELRTKRPEDLQALAAALLEEMRVLAERDGSFVGARHLSDPLAAQEFVNEYFADFVTGDDPDKDGYLSKADRKNFLAFRHDVLKLRKRYDSDTDTTDAMKLDLANKEVREGLNEIFELHRSRPAVPVTRSARDRQAAIDLEIHQKLLELRNESGLEEATAPADLPAETPVE